MQIWKNSVAMVTSILTYSSRRHQNVSVKFQEKSAKFGGPSLNCFEVIQLFSEGGPQKLPPDLNGVKEDYSK